MKYSNESIESKVNSTKEHIKGTTLSNSLFVKVKELDSEIHVTWEDIAFLVSEDEGYKMTGFGTAKEASQYLNENFTILKIKDERQLLKERSQEYEMER